MEKLEEISEKFKYAENLYRESKNLAEMQSKYTTVIENIRTFAKKMADKRVEVFTNGQVNTTIYKGINSGNGIAFDDFEKLIDAKHAADFKTLKSTIIPDVYKVKSLCQELSYIEPWLIKFDAKNYKRMDDYLQQYNDCIFCSYMDFDKAKIADQNLLDYLDRIQDDLEKAIEVLPTLYHHLDNVKISLKQQMDQ